MPNFNPPPSLPSSRANYTNGSHDNLPDNGANFRQDVPFHQPGSGPSFLALFLGAFAAVIALGVIGLAIYFGANALSPSGDGKNKSPLMTTASWQPGTEVARQLDASDKPDIGWWTKRYHLPKSEDVIAYLKNQGLDVGRIEPAHYQETADGTTLTYQVYAEVPAQLLHLQKATWHPVDPDQVRFADVLVLNKGLPAGTFWDTQNATVAAQAGTKLDFAWQVKWDKNSNTVTTDSLPLKENVFTEQQVSQYQTESTRTLASLQTQIQQIYAQVQSDEQTRLAQVPADPPKPEMLSSKFGGDGSGEPTKSAERIGGGTAAGAAGGALFGAVAKDPGLGAGIGAGVGLLSGIIYDTVSKSNDKKKHQREVADENASRLSDWKAQVKSLNLQRTAIKNDAVAEREKEMNDLLNRITAAKGDIFQIAAASPQASSVPQDNVAPVDPGPETPSGPIKRP